MKITGPFIATFFMLASLAAYAQEQPQLVYEKYLQSIQAMSSLENREFEKYISHRATGVIRKKIASAGKNLSAAKKQTLHKHFLQAWQAAAVLPSNSQITLQTAAEAALLSIVIADFPEQGMQQTVVVRFIRENDWKIDKVTREISSDEFNLKSIVF